MELKEKNNKPKRTLKQKIKVCLFESVAYLNYFYLRQIRGVDIGKHCHINRKSKIDGVNPHGVHMGDYVRLSQNALILAHDAYRGEAHQYVDTWIGHHVNIGWGAVINPGLKIGNHVYADVFVTMRVQRFTMFASFLHVSSFLQNHDYFNSPLYPHNGFAFRYGISWKFLD